MDFWADWKFWSFFVAAVALVLSQFPPVRSWFAKPKLQLDVFPRIFITHRAGNSNLQMQLILRNAGGKKLRVKGISATVVRDKKSTKDMPAHAYVLNPATNVQVLLTGFDIAPNEEWNNFTCFYPELERAQETEYRETVDLS